MHQAWGEAWHGGIVTEPTRIGWRCAAAPGSAAAADWAVDTGPALASGDMGLASAWQAPRSETAIAPAAALTMNPANDDICHMRTRSHPRPPPARQRAGVQEV